jgi:insulysin
VSDKDTQTAAATINVNVGSLADPGIDGLAHFCEHMLFLGTKKYPAENHYSKFLASHGGQQNASTSEDNTNYYFAVKNDALPEALDIFSQFFKEPLFTESATEREMNAVDSEFRKNVSNQARRTMQINKSHIARQGGILNRFSTGNLSTLNIPNIREHLLNFYDKHYSSNLMTLCLVGNHSLDTLQ